MPQATATIKKTNLMSGKFFLSFVHPRWETGSQLYQKRQLRKLANFSNPIQSTRNTLDSFLGKQLRRKWKIGKATFNSSGFSATGILPVKIFCLDINLIWRVDCHRVMLCSRISVGHSMGKTNDLSSFDINIFALSALVWWTCINFSSRASTLKSGTGSWPTLCAASTMTALSRPWWASTTASRFSPRATLSGSSVTRSFAASCSLLSCTPGWSGRPSGAVPTDTQGRSYLVKRN